MVESVYVYTCGEVELDMQGMTSGSIMIGFPWPASSTEAFSRCERMYLEGVDAFETH